ncbi:hypothetical protein FIM08_04400 [SAR202 cluster bacterium AC-647-N09_OGT_505m]|nr:hypothetical protein [SAR202 cluster bacterium AC-647-N09_OGT_505m]
MLAFELLFAALGLGIPLLIIGGIVYFILKLRGGASLIFSYQDALRVYFYAMILISVGLLALGGVSTLLKVGFGEIVGREFSYGEVYEEHRFIQERLVNQQEHLDNQLYPTRFEEETRSLTEKIEFAMRTSLINGVSLTGIGVFLWLVHFFGRRLVETQDQRSDSMRKLYLMAALTIFAMTTIASLSTGVPEALRYALLDINPGEESPGEPLSIAIVGLPVWLFYLVATIRTMRTSSDKDN